MVQGQRVAFAHELVMDGLARHIGPEERGEHRVHEPKDARHRAEVRDEHDLLADLAPDPGEELDVGTPEPVDRLLGVSHHEEAARLGVGERRRAVHCRRDARRQLDLDGIGVLEFVDEQAPVAAVQGSGRVGVLSQQSSGVDQQVVEPEASFDPALVGRAQHERRQPRPELTQHGLVSWPAGRRAAPARRLRWRRARHRDGLPNWPAVRSCWPA